jgi:hypothetical protein
MYARAVNIVSLLILTYYFHYVVLEDAKRRAERSREPQDRSLWAQYCVDIAVASVSVNLVYTVATWTRRFLRDPVRASLSVSDAGS